MSDTQNTDQLQNNIIIETIVIIVIVIKNSNNYLVTTEPILNYINVCMCKQIQLLQSCNGI